MIRFALTCGSGHEFEGWFRDNAAFDEQVTTGQLACPVCEDPAVRKAMMAPAVARGRGTGARPAAVDAMTAARLAQKIREHVEKNFDHVGDRFAEEARRIHYGDAEKRDIWGRASPTEAKELHEEGIPVRPMPEVPKLDG